MREGGGRGAKSAMVDEEPGLGLARQITGRRRAANAEPDGANSDRNRRRRQHDIAEQSGKGQPGDSSSPE
jgi:hypothetical protein